MATEPTTGTAPQSAADRGLVQLRRDADFARQWFAEAKEMFLAAAARNPHHAVEDCERVLQTQAAHETYFVAMSVMQDGETAAEQLNLLHDYVAGELRRFVELGPWRPNCTSPATNLVNTVSALGRGKAMVKMLEAIEWTKSEMAKETNP